MNREMPSDFALIMESVRFFCWIVGSITTLAITLLGIYLKMYVREALRGHAETIAAMVASNYVRRDVYDSDMRRLEGNA